MGLLQLPTAQVVTSTSRENFTTGEKLVFVAFVAFGTWLCFGFVT